MIEYVMVPAGERLQYFELAFLPEDLDALTAVHGVIGTFDGAREPDDDTTRNMILGGVVGAVAGMCAALASRRRQRRVLMQRAEQRAAGHGVAARED
jgi:hypothetical protein